MKKIIFLIIIIILSLILYINVNADIVIPDDAIRVRVVPNSNSVVDQNMKDKVKNYVSNYMGMKLNGIEDVDVAREVISNSLDELNSDISDMFKKYDYDLDFFISYGNNYFPDKVYRGIVYNAGEYESLVIYIGNSLGDNWWCILFPPLCLLEADENESDDVEYKSLVLDWLEKIF